jgi:hypothetical protein
MITLLNIKQFLRDAWSFFERPLPLPPFPPGPEQENLIAPDLNNDISAVFGRLQAEIIAASIEAKREHWFKRNMPEGSEFDLIGPIRPYVHHISSARLPTEEINPVISPKCTCFYLDRHENVKVIYLNTPPPWIKTSKAKTDPWPEDES